MVTRTTGDGFAASQTAVVGLYTYVPKTDRWSWSDNMFRIHGFDPGAVVPTTELVMRHIHPEDREAAWESREKVVADQEPFSFLHRIVTATNRERVVLAAGHLQDDPHEAPVVVGHLVDLTDVRADAVAEALEPAVADFVEHRAVIEQAKGVLVQLYSIDSDTAFALMRAFSMDANMKLRDIASVLVAAASRNCTPTKGRAPSPHDMLVRLYADTRGAAADVPAGRTDRAPDRGAAVRGSI